ncbi:ZIP family metal transporter [Deltaproteobacteria bacterium]|nr:ZIP family metal transporter [Deltaproteobacteria bacterium]
MAEAPFLYVALTLVIALIAGLIPVFSKIKDNQERLKIMTAIASGIIIASAMLVVIPEGYEIATQEDAHTEDDALAGSIALVLLEVNHGDITNAQAIEEIEGLLGGHDDHDGHEEESDHDSHEEESNHEASDETLSDSVKHIIEEYEEGAINATAALNEIETAISGHNHAGEESHAEHINGLLLGGAILAGFMMMFILEGSGIGHAVHEEHHNHGDEHGHEHVHHSNSGWMLVLGLTLHSATDGLAIGAAAASGSIALTATVALAVLIHKAPAAFSLGVFSMHEREERNDTIKDVVIFSLATPVMMLLAYYALADLESHLIGLAMLFSAGTFLYIATVDTLPDIHNPETGKKAVMYVLVGVAILTLLLILANTVGLLEHAH